MSIIRFANKEDFHTIREIAEKTWPITFKDILSPNQITYMLNMMYSYNSLLEQTEKKGHKFILVSLLCHQELSVGYCSFEHNYLESGRTKIHKLYVLPEYQGSGYGSLLIDAVANISYSAGDSKIVLNVNRENKAVEFYHRKGFITIANEDISIGNGFFMNDFVMEADIHELYINKKEDSGMCPPF